MVVVKVAVARRWQGAMGREKGERNEEEKE